MIRFAFFLLSLGLVAPVFAQVMHQETCFITSTDSNIKTFDCKKKFPNGYEFPAVMLQVQSYTQYSLNNTSVPNTVIFGTDSRHLKVGDKCTVKYYTYPAGLGNAAIIGCIR